MMINEQNYVDKAENVIKQLKENSKQTNKRGQESMVTTSKIRNLLSMTADIYNQILNEQTGETLSAEMQGRIEYLRVRFLYDAGRDDQVRAFVETAGILQILKEIQNKRVNFLLFNRYMEALVAFHRYYGGRD